MGDTSEATDLGCSATLDSLSEMESFLVRAALGVVVAAPQLRWFQDAVPAGDAAIAFRLLPVRRAAPRFRGWPSLRDRSPDAPSRAAPSQFNDVSGQDLLQVKSAQIVAALSLQLGQRNAWWPWLETARVEGFGAR